MSSVYIVTSVILGASESVFDSNTRAQQTKQTIRSIRHHDPSAAIILCEGSDFNWSTVCDRDQDVTYIVCNPRIPSIDDYIGHRSIGEAMMIKHALQSKELASLCPDRIFKISGRYELSQDFDPEIHRNTDKIVVRRCVSYRPGRFSTLTVLYSFPMKYMSYIIERLDFIIDVCKHPEPDSIEHAIFGSDGDCLDDRFLCIPVMGATGIIAPSGFYWSG